MKSTYQIDPAHSTAQFVVRHMMITNVRGAFSNVKGTVVYDPENLADTSIEATIDVNTISTQDPNRDTHLKSPEFFSAEQFPSMTFKSTKVEKDGSDLKVTGDLTIHGVTKQTVLDVESPSAEGKDPWGNTRMGTSAKTKIKRSDFGLTYNATLETGGILIGDEIKIELEISMIKSAA